MPMFWLALIVALVLTIASAIFLTLRGLEAFRGFKRLSVVAGAELDADRSRERRDRAPPRARGRERDAAGGVAGAPPLLARAAERPDGRDRGRARGRRPRHGRRAAQVRVASVDLGTNSTRLLVADANGDARGGRSPARDHAARRGRRRAPPAAAAPDRARAQRPLRLPPRARAARRRADALHRARAPSATPRTARPSSARSSGATASRRAC